MPPQVKGGVVGLTVINAHSHRLPPMPVSSAQRRPGRAVSSRHTVWPGDSQANALPTGSPCRLLNHYVTDGLLDARGRVCSPGLRKPNNPAWTSSRNVWPSRPPHPRRYSGSRKTATARRPGWRRNPRTGFADRPADFDTTEPPTSITPEPARTPQVGAHAQQTSAPMFEPGAKVLLEPDPPAPNADPSPT